MTDEQLTGASQMVPMIDPYAAAKKMRSERLVAEYEICQRRGHQPANVMLTSYPPQNVCKWCGVNYRTESSQVESNVPKWED